MNKKELSEKFAEAARITQAEAYNYLTVLFDAEKGILARALASKRDGEVHLAGFGKLEVRTMKARTHRNPATGETFEAPARRVVRFKCGSTLSELVKEVR